jgi:hypothetical protein
LGQPTKFAKYLASLPLARELFRFFSNSAVLVACRTETLRETPVKLAQTEVFSSLIQPCLAASVCVNKAMEKSNEREYTTLMLPTIERSCSRVSEKERKRERKRGSQETREFA